MLCGIGIYGFPVRVDVHPSVARYAHMDAVVLVVARMCLSDPNAATYRVVCGSPNVVLADPLWVV